MKIVVAGGTGTVGRQIVETAQRHGHEVVTLSRSTGVNLETGSGLASTLRGADVVIDVTSVKTQSASMSERFFGAVTDRLLSAEQSAGVKHHIALSIVGSDKAPYGYYAGKAVQERLIVEGRIPWTILRATQFHEFAKQIYGQSTVGPIHLVPRMVSQPVAAVEVAKRLVELAEHGPAGRPADLAGPEVLRMADMVKAYSRATGSGGFIIELPLPGAFGRALRSGTLTADPGAVIGRLSFSTWLSEFGGARA